MRDTGFSIVIPDLIGDPRILDPRFRGDDIFIGMTSCWTNLNVCSRLSILGLDKSSPYGYDLIMRKHLPLIVIAVFTTLAFVSYFRFFSNAQTPLKDLSLSGLYDASQTAAFWHGERVAVGDNTENLGYTGDVGKTVLSASAREKRIEIDLTNQKLYAYEGDKKVYEFLVSTGKWGRTPIGEFTVWAKPKYTLMTGGSTALQTYYYLPNVPFVQFFYNNEVSKWAGYGLHGTYWHDNFGHPMSHGCINMKTGEAEQLFYWTNPVYKAGGWATYASASDPGTKIIIYGEAPRE